jgi:hypothetical protein
VPPRRQSSLRQRRRRRARRRFLRDAQIAWGFLLHGLVRAGAGFRGAADPTLAALAACSYALEAAMFFREVTVHGTVSDPVPMYVLPFFAVACAGLARGGKAKTA